MKFRELIKSDAQVYETFFFLHEDGVLSKLKFFFKLLFLNEFRCVLNFRIRNYLYTKGFKTISFILYYYSKKKYNCDIANNAKIGSHFRVGHSSDIVIGPDVTIGNYFTVFNGVTLGNKNIFDKNGNLNLKNSMPLVGNNVLLGTGAKILGAIQISDNVTVGANSIVLKDVGENSVIYGVH